MLVLSRKASQSIQIGENITLKVVRVRGNAVQLGIEAPSDVRVMRAEILGKPAGGGEERSNSSAGSHPVEREPNDDEEGEPHHTEIRSLLDALSAVRC